jgi:hypothetical protein
VGLGGGFIRSFANRSFVRACVYIQRPFKLLSTQPNQSPPPPPPPQTLQTPDSKTEPHKQNQGQDTKTYQTNKQTYNNDKQTTDARQAVNLEEATVYAHAVLSAITGAALVLFNADRTRRVAAGGGGGGEFVRLFDSVCFGFGFGFVGVCVVLRVGRERRWVSELVWCLVFGLVCVLV